MVLRTSSLRGDFPVALEIRLREDTPDLRTLLSGAARLLGASILTDELVVNPLFTSDWLMFTPDGDVIVIEADEEEFAADEPAIVLTPESRRVYEARHRPAERLATTVSNSAARTIPAGHMPFAPTLTAPGRIATLGACRGHSCSRFSSPSSHTGGSLT
jgi:hypothetical protein